MSMSVSSQLDRRAAVAALLGDRGDTLVVSGLGSPTYDLHATGDRDDNFGSGLIDPLQALQLADPRTATTTPPAPRPATRQR